MRRNTRLFPVGVVFAVFGVALLGFGYLQLRPEPGPEIPYIPPDTETINLIGTSLTVAELRVQLRELMSAENAPIKKECKRARSLSFEDAIVFWRRLLNGGDDVPIADINDERNYVAIVQDECRDA